MGDPGLTNMTYNDGWMPPDFGDSDFSAAGLTVGRIGASAGLESSPETRTFSSPMAATGARYDDDGQGWEICDRNEDWKLDENNE